MNIFFLLSPGNYHLYHLPFASTGNTTFMLKYLFIWAYLTYNVTLVSSVQHSNLISLYIYAMFTINGAISVTKQHYYTIIDIFFMLFLLFPRLIYSITGSLYLLLPFTYFAHSPHSGNHQFVLCIYRSDSVFCLLIHFFFFLFHIWVKSYGIYLSWSDSFHLA